MYVKKHEAWRNQQSIYFDMTLKNLMFFFQSFFHNYIDYYINF